MNHITLPEAVGVYEYAIVHCAATPPSLDEGANWVDRVHRRKGWSRCGYHLVIRRDGTIEWQGTGHPTRPIGSPGAHVGGCGPGWNERSLGICLMGGVKEDGKTPENNFTEAQLSSLTEIIYELTANGIDQENIIGHRDLIKMTNAAPKACPCFSVREWMDGWEDVEDGFELYDVIRAAFDWIPSLRPAEHRNSAMKVPKSYTVRDGDTLWSISRTLGVRLKDIQRLNKNLDPTTLQVGQRIRLLD